ncbi:MAG: hypothetical protein AB7S51_07780 [Porticoccaceae bacterium]
MTGAAIAAAHPAAHKATSSRMASVRLALTVLARAPPGGVTDFARRTGAAGGDAKQGWQAS